jgi:UDP-3-O-[3-hydroxymyristoyl] N-acetylglucosamine deacetylase/3-hydroxyacyl-[acyl-carrier-protein] dehydratase
MRTQQSTIKKSVTVSGVGLHTGVPVTLTFHPAPENHWYVFKRIDLEEQPCINLLFKVSDLLFKVSDSVFSEQLAF